VKRYRRSEPELVMTPESAVWLLYAGLVQGIRWRRHLAASPRPAVPTATQPLRRRASC
jgi:hypothetical protein